MLFWNFKFDIQTTMKEDSEILSEWMGVVNSRSYIYCIFKDRVRRFPIRWVVLHLRLGWFRVYGKIETAFSEQYRGTGFAAMKSCEMRQCNLFCAVLIVHFNPSDSWFRSDTSFCLGLHDTENICIWLASLSISDVTGVDILVENEDKPGFFHGRH